MKLFQKVASQWRISAILACMCMLMLAGLQLAADDSDSFGPDIPDAPATSDESDEAIDFEGKIEITVNGGIRSRTRTEHSTSVVVKNISDEDIEGPLALVIEAPGLDLLEVVESDGTLASGEPYVELISEKAWLRAGAALRPKKVEFTSEDAIPLNDRREFAPEFRVVRLTDEDQENEVADSAGGNEDNLPGKSYSQEDFDGVIAVQEKWTVPLMQQGNGDVFGTAVAEDDQGNLVVRVYTSRAGVIRELPGDVDGVPLQDLIIGAPFISGPELARRIRREREESQQEGEGSGEQEGGEEGEATAPPSGDEAPANDDVPDAEFTGTPLDPTIRFPRPVPTGVSVGNIFITAGTLGCRCMDPIGTEMALSNCHVFGGVIFEADNSFIIDQNPNFGATPVIFDGFMFGFIGDPIVQPGPIDGGTLLDQIGTLADFEFILLDKLQDCVDGIAPINIIDAAVMAANPGDVHFCTPPDGYGAPSRNLCTPRLGMQVKKYGRTTINTVGQITAVNSSTCVGYSIPDDLFGYFIRQIECANLVPVGSPFSQGGDSGSLIVCHDPGGPDDNKPVALLFAGGPQGLVDVTIANPLGPIQARFNIQIDDGSGAPSSGGMSGTSGGVIGPLDVP